MPDALEEYRKRGWTVFASDPAIRSWAEACAPLAERISSDPNHAHWWRCDGTWFAGVNVLPNDARGGVDGEIPPLSGSVISFIEQSLGFEDVAFDAAQISIVTPGYPALGEEDTEASWRFRIKRCAAHVDGLERSMPDRRRKLSETHGFLLGIPLSDANAEQGAFVVWEGSHELMRAAFRERFADTPPESWRSLDITQAYTAARKQVFERCTPVEIAPGLGAAYVMHPLALHGVAPWRGGDAPARAVAYFRPDTFGGDPEAWLNS